MPICPHCPRSFDSSHALKIHIGRTHKSAADSSVRSGRQKRRGVGQASHGGAANLAEVSTAALVAELRKRAEIGDRLKAIIS